MQARRYRGAQPLPRRAPPSCCNPIHIERDARKAAADAGAGEKVAALSALHAMLAGALRRIHDDHESCPSGAFQDSEIFRRADEYEAEVLGIADSYEKAGHAKMAVMLRNAAPLVAHCLRFPGLSPITNDIERVMLQIALHRNVRFKTMTAEGRRRLADLLTCILTWIRRGYRIVDKLHEVLGIDPPKEYAAIRAAAAASPLRRPPPPRPPPAES